MTPDKKQMKADAEYLRGIADGLQNSRIQRAAEALDDAANHVCGQGFYGCPMGDKCESDHK